MYFIAILKRFVNFLLKKSGFGYFHICLVHALQKMSFHRFESLVALYDRVPSHNVDYKAKKLSVPYSSKNVLVIFLIIFFKQ